MTQYAGKKKNHTLHIDDAFESISELWLYNFDMYRKTSDANWLIKGYTGKETKIQIHLLKPIETVINNEYYEATRDRTFELMIGRFAKIDALIAKYSRSMVLIDRISKGFGDSDEGLTTRYLFITQLNLEGFKMPVVAGLIEDFENLQVCREQLQGIKTRIELLQDENKRVEGKVSMTLGKQMLIVSMGLQLGYKLDSKKITVMEWVEMNQLLEERSKNN